MTEREFATDIVRRLQEAGFQALFAGGCVRDELLGLPPADFDVATSAVPDEVTALFRRCHGFGASFGVVEVLGPRGADGEWLKVQVATFRSDGEYLDGRRPGSVTFSSPEEDAARRDFTINGMFLDPVSNRLIDYVGGRADLDARILRAIGDPVLRFTEDRLRVLRAVRMAARFELAVDPATHAAATRMADGVPKLSAERIAEELRKLLVHANRVRGVELLRDFGLMGYVLPEVSDVEARMKVIASLSPSPLPQGEGGTVGFPLVFAALLGDVSAKVAAAVCRRLRFSNDELDRVVWLVGHRTALREAPTMRNSKLFPLLVQPGTDDLIRLHEAEAVAAGDDLDHVVCCANWLRTRTLEELNPPPLLTGDDLQALGLKPGPKFKTILEAIRAAQLDGELLSSDEAAARVRAEHLGYEP